MSFDSGIVALILFFARIKPRYYRKNRDTTDYYNESYVPLVIIFTMLLVTCTLAIFVYICYYLCDPIEAVVVEEQRESHKRGKPRVSKKT